MRSQEKNKSKRYIKTLEFVTVEETSRGKHFVFKDEDNIIWDHYQVSVADAMKYGGLTAANKAAKYLKACKNLKSGMKVKAVCVIRQMDDSAYNEKDIKSHIYGNVDEIL